MNEGPPRGAWLAAHTTVFISSFCVMVVELVAGRIISRHLGSSIYTWTSVIGVILAGLALGNYVGGRLADRHPSRPLLSLLFVLSSATCVAITIANNLIGSWQFLWDLAWPARVAAHVGLVFFVPAALLGTIGPIVAASALGLGRETGRTLGSVSAWGVVGSIAGTFATGYVLIDRMTTPSILWSVAAVLGLIGLSYMPRAAGSWAWSAALIAACVLANGSWSWARTAGEHLALRTPTDPLVIYSDESLYSHIEIRKVSEDGDTRGLYLDKLLHSTVSLSDPTMLDYDYARIFAELTHLRQGDRPGPRTLTIGGGGYVFPRYLELTWPGSTNDVVEIDPAVTRAAREAFGLPANTTIRSHHTDGRVFVNREVERRSADDDALFDFVYLDAVNDYSVPFQLTTIEFFGKVESLLAPDGMLLVNCIDILDSGRVIGALARTLREVFPEVQVFTLGGHARMRGDSRLTFVLAASRSPIGWTPERSEDVDLLPADRVAGYVHAAGDIVLADAFAPVEALLAPVVLASSREVAASEALVTALARAARGDDEGFLRYCREAVERDPLFPEAHYNLGVALYGRGEQAQAIDHWRQALRIDRAYAEAHYNLGAALYAAGEFEVARLHLLEAARLQPQKAQPQIAAGIALEATGEFAGAISHFAKALRIEPDSAEARGHLARLDLAAEATGRFDPDPSRP